MDRVQNLSHQASGERRRRRWPRGIAMAAALWTGLVSAAAGQQATLLTGHDGTPLLDVREPSLSRDGRTLLLFANGRRFHLSLPDETQLLVVRQGEAAPVFATTPAEADTFQGRLSADGQHVAYRTLFSTGYTVMVRDLASGVERTAHATVGRPIPTVIDIDENGADVLVLDTDFSSSTNLVVRRVSPAAAVAMQPPCEATNVTAQADAAPTSELSADGTTVAFLSLTAVHKAIIGVYEHAIGSATTGAAECVRLVDPRVHPVPQTEGRPLFLSRTGRFVAGTASPVASAAGRAFVMDRADGRVHLLGQEFLWSQAAGLSEDGRHLLMMAQVPGETVGSAHVVDRVTGVTVRVSAGFDGLGVGPSVILSGDGRTVLFQTTSQPDGLRTYLVTLDADGDGLLDAWETAYGLDPFSPGDAALDPDGDGQTNAQEFAAGTHPRATPVRYFAEGASGGFFDTGLAIFNPGAVTATANVRFLGPDGATASHLVTVAAGTPVYFDASTLGLSFTEFSIVVESPVPLSVERRMTWDRTSAYGTHSGTGVAAPATQSHFAEGATIAGIQTFFLLQNPGLMPALTTMRYLLADGTVEQRSHEVPGQSRLTVWANHEGAAMAAAEFATTISADVPIVAERAMYRDAPGEPFGAGSVVSGVTTPSTSWFFAEGATGSFFDTYLLLANPADTPATVDVEFVRPYDIDDTTTVQPVLRRSVLPAQSRRTIWVAQEDFALLSTQVSARMTSDVPIIAERAMWWPGPTSATWRANHVETGATTGGQLWAVANIQADATDGGWDTFVTIATMQQQLAAVRIQIACADGTTASTELSLPVNRTTLWMRHEFPEIVGRRCAATIESLPKRVTLSPVVPLMRAPLVVETATYLGGDFRAGGATLATRLPDPP